MQESNTTLKPSNHTNLSMHIFRNIYPVLLTVLELAIVILPMLFGIFFLFRKSETYEEKYKNSVFYRTGTSKRKYVIFFRTFGFIFILISLFAIWRVYFYEPSNEGISEIKEFWKDIDKATEKNIRLSENLKSNKDFFVCL